MRMSDLQLHAQLASVFKQIEDIITVHVQTKYDKHRHSLERQYAAKIENMEKKVATADASAADAIKKYNSLRKKYKNPVNNVDAATNEQIKPIDRNSPPVIASENTNALSAAQVAAGAACATQPNPPMTEKTKALPNDSVTVQRATLASKDVTGQVTISTATITTTTTTANTNVISSPVDSSAAQKVDHSRLIRKYAVVKLKRLDSAQESASKPIKDRRIRSRSTLRNQSDVATKYVDRKTRASSVDDDRGQRSSERRTKLVSRSTENINGDEFVCDICDRGFSKSKSLSIHKRMHSKLSEKHFNCTMCGENCTSKSAHEKHMRMHYSPKSYNCSFARCLRVFSNASELTRHENKHSASVTKQPLAM